MFAACQRFDSGSQMFSDDRYPFHVVRYLCHPKMPYETICSTLYSFSVPIRSGGGFEKFGPCASVSL